MAPSLAYRRCEKRLRGEVAVWYSERGDVVGCYAFGSLVEGWTETADLDVSVVWGDGPPPARERLPVPIADGEPSALSIDEPGFVVDRFFLDGQQVDVHHHTVAELDHWVAEISTGRGDTGYPMPVIGLHALMSGIILADDGRIGVFRTAFADVPTAFISATAARERSGRDSYLDELDRCVDRHDGLLFHSLAVEALHRGFIAWFARHNWYWPHEKRLGQRLTVLGSPDLAALEGQVWGAATLRDKRLLIEELLSALSSDS